MYRLQLVTIKPKSEMTVISLLWHLALMTYGGYTL